MTSSWKPEIDHGGKIYTVDTGKNFALGGFLFCFVFCLPGVMTVKHLPLFLKLQNSRTEASLMPLRYLPSLSSLPDY